MCTSSSWALTSVLSTILIIENMPKLELLKYIINTEKNEDAGVEGVSKSKYGQVKNAVLPLRKSRE